MPSIALLHLHRTLAYLLFLVALVDVVLALTAARTDPRMAKLAHWAHQLGVLWSGRLNLLLGIGLIFVLGYPAGAWWAWAAVVLWGPVEVVGKRLVTAELAAVREGGAASGRLVMGAVIQLLLVVIIFGLMTVRP